MNIGILQGDSYEDSRGVLKYNNDFNMGFVKRFYVIEHPDISIIRAWQAHKKENKWFMVLSGSFKLVFVQPDNWTQPSEYLPYNEYLLKEKNNEIIHVPSGFANGFKALEPNSKLMVFSDASVE